MTVNERVYAADILRGERITDRCLRGWIARGAFPKPDGNLLGRNYWHGETYRQWLGDVAAGKFAQSRRPPGARALPVAS